jgi:hypothetical protein
MVYTSGLWSRGSSVSVVSGYELGDGRSRFDPRQTRKNFSSSLCVQTRSGAHPASCAMGPAVGPFAGGKARPGLDADHLPHLVSRSWMSRSYTLSPQASATRVAGLLHINLSLACASPPSHHMFQACLSLRKCGQFLSCKWEKFTDNNRDGCVL